jgi:DNA polymerase-1
VYLDYSQIELRIQAVYTILVGTPEPNLCRAYMPFRCHSEEYGDFDPRNTVHISSWNAVRWFLAESPEELWTPIDVHAATTKYAFGVDEKHPDFKKLRSIGKTINFAKNYGAGFGRMRDMFPDKTVEEVNRINDAYYMAFPGVKGYHDYCYSVAMSTAFVPNLFGVKYYNVSGHNLINMLIQGSGAYLMKMKIREIWEYCEEHHIKSRFQMNIHDELSWEWHQDDPPELFYEFKRIMEDWEDSMVPIVAEMAFTKTTWDEKKDIHGIGELQ